MIEVNGNLWTYPADVRVITTNGFVKKDGTCVMGRGCALEATQKFPGLPKLLGDLITAKGNVVHFLIREMPALLTLPVKHKWFEKADPQLIALSCVCLVRLADVNGWKTIVLPRPGCGNGQLKWEDVKPILEPILDDRFHVITF
jgi:hypothetical protein